MQHMFWVGGGTPISLFSISHLNIIVGILYNILKTQQLQLVSCTPAHTGPKNYPKNPKNYEYM